MSENEGESEESAKKKKLDGGGERPENSSSSLSVRSHLSEEVRPFLMGGSVLIRVSSWPFSNFTHQREHHPVADIPERGCRNLEDFQRFARRARSYLNPQGGKKKAQWYFWCYEYLTFMLQLAVCLRLLILYCCPCYFFFCSCLEGFHNANQQLSGMIFFIVFFFFN